jgi:hypothetical protein
LRFLDVDPNAEDEKDDTLRLSLELVGGVPGLRATGEQGESFFELP